MIRSEGSDLHCGLVRTPDDSTQIAYLIAVTYQVDVSALCCKRSGHIAGRGDDGITRDRDLAVFCFTDDPSVLDGEDQICFADGGKTLGDRDDGPLPGPVIRQPYGTGSCS